MAAQKEDQRTANSHPMNLPLSSDAAAVDAQARLVAASDGELFEEDLQKATGGTSAPNLFISCCTGKHYPKATITLR